MPRITDEQGIDAGPIQDARKGGVVTGQHGNFLAGGMHLAQAVERDRLAAVHPPL